MAHKLDVHRVDDALDGLTLFRLHGFFTDCKESYQLLKDVRHASEGKAIRLVLNMEEVTHLTSGGVGVLAACYTSVTGAGGTMCLVGLNERATLVLETVGLAQVMDCYESEASIAPSSSSSSEESAPPPPA